MSRIREQKEERKTERKGGKEEERCFAEFWSILLGAIIFRYAFLFFFCSFLGDVCGLRASMSIYLFDGSCWRLFRPYFGFHIDISATMLCFFYLVLIWFHPPSYELIDWYMKWVCMSSFFFYHLHSVFAFYPVSGTHTWNALFFSFLCVSKELQRVIFRRRVLGEHLGTKMTCSSG